MGVVVQALVFGALWGSYKYWQLRAEIRASRAGRRSSDPVTPAPR
ncbi:hypothetical protein HIDPHFAB_01632 [Nocardioides sp. T2.26MG-1]|nr:hypothetical protein HIDPHFAB_01632 [Nocardioides sp. T2.26MG-1]